MGQSGLEETSEDVKSNRNVGEGKLTGQINISVTEARKFLPEDIEP